MSLLPISFWAHGIYQLQLYILLIMQICCTFPNTYKELYTTLLWTDLSMNKDHRSQEPPRPSLSIHVQHAQDLQESNAPVEHVTSAPSVFLFRSNWALLIFLLLQKTRSKSPQGQWLLYLMADVANTWPLDPTPSTMIEAMTTIKSEGWRCTGKHKSTHTNNDKIITKNETIT